MRDAYIQWRAGALAAVLMLSGCGGVSPPPQEPAAPESSPAPSSSSAAAGGGYYLDDGPPEQSAAALAAIPDAVVRSEKINPAHNRPYVVLGKRYVPFTALRPYRKRGIASWYGKRYHGRKTASGEVYDMHQMTAAHPILPIPSYVRVTHAGTGKSAVVRVNDRGPFLQGREIDLSYAAASKLGIVQAGTGEVIVELIVPEEAPPFAAEEEKAAAPVPPPPPPPAPAAPASDERVAAAQPLTDEVFVQLAAFADSGNADRFAADLAERLPAALAQQLTIYIKAGGIYAVQIGPYASHDAAAGGDKELCEAYQLCGFLTKRYE